MRAMRRRIVAASLMILAAAAGLAVEIAGIQMPDTDTVDGKMLKLNGAGIRKKMLFKVYAAGLYLETPSKDAAAAISATEVKSMRLHILRRLKGGQIAEAISEGFERNSKEQLPKLSARLEKLKQMIPDVSPDDLILFSNLPGKGIRVTVRGTERGTIEGRDFSDALFSVWLGPNPVQEDLKKALLGR